MDVSSGPPTADRVEALFHHGSLSGPLSNNEGEDISQSKPRASLISDLHLGTKLKDILHIPPLDVGDDDDDDIVLYTPQSTKFAIPETLEGTFVKNKVIRTTVLSSQGETPSIPLITTAFVETGVAISTSAPPLVTPTISIMPSTGTATISPPVSHHEPSTPAPRAPLKPPNKRHQNKRRTAKEVESKSSLVNRRPLIRNSDVEWSTASDDDGVGGPIPEDAEAADPDPGMEIDADVDSAAYNTFIAKLSATGTETQLTAADIEDQERIDIEDDDEDAWEDVSESDAEMQSPQRDSKIHPLESSDDGSDDGDMDENEEPLATAFQWDEDDREDEESIIRAETLQVSNVSR